FVFPNDFPALTEDAGDGDPATPAAAAAADDVFRAETEAGTARVFCFSERHDLSLGALPVGRIRDVVDLWAGQSAELGATYRWVQVFENRGEAMGASNPHPHGQVWAGTALPVEAAREDATQRARIARTRRKLLSAARVARSNRPKAACRSVRARARRPTRRGHWSGMAGRRAVLGDVAVRGAAP